MSKHSIDKTVSLTYFTTQIFFQVKQIFVGVRVLRPSG